VSFSPLALWRRALSRNLLAILILPSPVARSRGIAPISISPSAPEPRSFPSLFLALLFISLPATGSCCAQALFFSTTSLTSEVITKSIDVQRSPIACNNTVFSRTAIVAASVIGRV
jgi:hypothetical protein